MDIHSNNMLIINDDMLVCGKIRKVLEPLGFKISISKTLDNATSLLLNYNNKFTTIFLNPKIFKVKSTLTKQVNVSNPNELTVLKTINYENIRQFSMIEIYNHINKLQSSSLKVIVDAKDSSGLTEELDSKFIYLDAECNPQLLKQIAKHALDRNDLLLKTEDLQSANNLLKTQISIISKKLLKCEKLYNSDITEDKYNRIVNSLAALKRKTSINLEDVQSSARDIVRTIRTR